MRAYCRPMTHSFSGSTVIDRPIEEVSDFLAAGVNDPTFSPPSPACHKNGATVH
jgi:hypothetical protein